MNDLIRTAKTNKVGLVLGGGGSRGAYECGVIKALDQLGVKADVVVGTSVGSLIGACYTQNEVEAAIEIYVSSAGPSGTLIESFRSSSTAIMNFAFFWRAIKTGRLLEYPPSM